MTLYTGRGGKVHQLQTSALDKDRSSAPAALQPQKEPPVLDGKETGWTPEPVWTQQWRWKR